MILIRENIKTVLQSRWWLHNSLESLNKSIGSNLSVYNGNPLDIFSELVKKFDVEAVYWNRCYEPWAIARDKKIKVFLEERKISVKSFNALLLWEPWDIKKKDGTAYKVFTPFYRKGCLVANSPREPLAEPKNINYIFDDNLGRSSIDDLGLLPEIRWDKQFKPHWQVGEDGAHKALDKFISDGLSSYREGRDVPSKNSVSRLSPHLHFGEISPNYIWYKIQNFENDENTDHFFSELGWREFSYSQLYYNPDLPEKNLQSKFDKFPWVHDLNYLKAWQRGMTGIPMVDAGMRELWQTGYMHNRVRMIVGSFLVKNLRLHWHHGERWFWDTLVDADLANNSASWQWVAGCGADAAPYFRIFNPVTQGQRFDPDGKYIRKYIPEIAALQNKYIFSPWEAPDLVLEEAGIELGETYPRPIVDLKKSRQDALDAFSLLKGK